MVDYFDANAANGATATTDATVAQPIVNGGEQMDEISVCITRPLLLTAY
jgi:hypothetical protein